METWQVNLRGGLINFVPASHSEALPFGNILLLVDAMLLHNNLQKAFDLEQLQTLEEELLVGSK